MSLVVEIWRRVKIKLSFLAVHVIVKYTWYLQFFFENNRVRTLDIFPRKG